MGEPILLNIYDLIMDEGKSSGMSREALAFIGMGLYHSGIEVFGEEYSFGMDPTGRNDPSTDGIFVVEPRRAVGRFREQIELGRLPISPQQVQQVLDRMRPEWRANTYHMLSHNCNYFTRAFAEALSPSLVEKIPSWLNRASKAGNVVIPDSMVKSVTDAVGPPAASNVDLINKIYIPHQGAPPKPLPASNPQPVAKAEGGGFGFLSKAKEAVSNAANATGVSVLQSDQTAFHKEFPEAPASDFVEKVHCHVLHINRVQGATLWIAKHGFGFSGKNSLHLLIPFNAVTSLQYARAVDGVNLSQPPTFEPTNDAGKSDAVLIFLQGNVLIPVFRPGTTAGKAVSLISGSTPTQKLLAALDAEWRQNVRL